MAAGQANLNAQKLHLDLQSAKQGETKKLETKLSAALEENAVLRAKVCDTACESLDSMIHRLLLFVRSSYRDHELLALVIC